MEDTTMTKKYYIAPVLEILDAEMEDEILLVSPVTQVNTPGLDDDELVRDNDNSSGDSWSSAW